MKRIILFTLILGLSAVLSQSLAQGRRTTETILAKNKSIAASSDVAIPLFDLSAAKPDLLSDSAAIQLHNVVGTGFVDLRDDLDLDVQFRVTVAAAKLGGWAPKGGIVTQLWLGFLDIPKITAQSRVTCMVVDGESAWIGSVVTHSTNYDIMPVGTSLITTVFDLGGQGHDIMHQEQAAGLPLAEFDTDEDGDVDCHDRPSLFPSVVDSGNFHVR